eukprot:928905-Pelagomonas_calceolata.AAC.2
MPPVQEGGKFFFKEGACTFWSGPTWTPPTPPPLPVPLTGQQGYQSAPFLIPHPSAYSAQ